MMRFLLSEKRVLVTLLVTTGFTQTSFANQSDIENTNQFRISGDIRAGWLDYDYDNPDGISTINKGHKDSEGFYIIPKLSINTPILNGFSGKVTFAAATDFGINDPDKASRLLVYDGNDNKDFALVQELYVEFNSEKHHALLGRNEIYTPMIEHDDYYMLSNSFGVAHYKNSSLDNTDIHAGYFYDMAGVWDSGANGTEFNSMSDASFVPQINKDEADDEGVWFGAVDFNNDLHQAQLWNYHATDLYNTVFAQYNFTPKSETLAHDFGLQFIDFSEIGKLKSSATKIDYNITSVKYDVAFNNGWSIASGAAKYSDGEGQGATLGAWGGFPYFAYGMIFNFFETGTLRDAESYKLQGAYDISKSSTVSVRYTYYDLNSSFSTSSDGRSQDYMEMIGIRLNHNFGKAGYFTGTYEHHDVDAEPNAWALRLIGGYKF